jgi:hypothetical protein
MPFIRRKSGKSSWGIVSKIINLTSYPEKLNYAGEIYTSCDYYLFTLPDSRTEYK